MEAESASCMVARQQSMPRSKLIIFLSCFSTTKQQNFTERRYPQQALAAA